MKSWFLPSSSSTLLEYLGFFLFLLLVCIGLGGFIVWLTVTRKKPDKRKRRRRHHRPINPTLDQTGGLPPRRDPNLPPPGP
ncbi:MAG: hypothetical protein ABSH48_12755 [Verrucomicrobiota bacterium]|jgi:hypothetical protein